MSVVPDTRLNAIRFAKADPAQALAAAALAVALSDAEKGSREAREWLAEGDGARWAAMLGADELLADTLAGLD